MTTDKQPATAPVDGALMMSNADARALTDEIKAAVENLWHLVVRAYTERAWEVLGYDTWDLYCIGEFSGCRLRLPREERVEAVQSLRHAGLSIRAIASATGIDKNTVQSDLGKVSEIHTPDAEPLDVIAPGGVTDSTPGQTDRVAEALAKAKAKLSDNPTPDNEPETITGTDGKQYAKRKPKADKGIPKPPTPQPEPEAARPPVNLDDDDEEEWFRFWLSAPTRLGQTGTVESYIGYVEDIYAQTMDDCDPVLPVDAEDLGEILEALPHDPTMTGEYGERWRPDPAALAAYDDAKAAAKLADRLAWVLPRVVELWELLAERAAGESIKLLPATVIDGVKPIRAQQG
jgi:hypothetical protein